MTSRCLDTSEILSSSVCSLFVDTANHPRSALNSRLDERLLTHLSALEIDCYDVGVIIYLFRFVQPRETGYCSTKRSKPNARGVTSALALMSPRHSEVVWWHIARR